MVRSTAGGNLTDYRVTIEYRRPPAFEITVTADGSAMAKRLAQDAAFGCGWTDCPRRFTVTPLQRQRGEA